MSGIDWTSEAARFSAAIAGLDPPRPRGTDRTDLPGVSVAFAPAGERTRIERLLSDAGVEVLVARQCMGPMPGAYSYVALLRSTDLALIEGILAATGNPRATPVM